MTIHRLNFVEQYGQIFKTKARKLKQKADKGFIPVMLTPFKENGAIDFDGLERLTEFYLEAGATGLFANCLSSEMFELSPEERIKITKRVWQIAGHRADVISTGSFGATTDEQVDFIKRLYDTGIKAVILSTNALVSEQETDDLFKKRVFDTLDRTGNIPFGFYECPDPYKRLLSPELLLEMVATGRVVYHKDTSLDIEMVREKLRLTHSFDFGLYDAYMVHAIESLRAGAAGLSCIQGNYFPELIVWICQHFDEPASQEQLRDVMNLLTESMDVMHDLYPTVAKYFLSKRGLRISSFTRRNVGQFNRETEQRIDLLFDRLEDLCLKLELDLAV